MRTAQEQPLTYEERRAGLALIAVIALAALFGGVAFFAYDFGGRGFNTDAFVVLALVVFEAMTLRMLAISLTIIRRDYRTFAAAR